MKLELNDEQIKMLFDYDKTSPESILALNLHEVFFLSTT